MLPSKFISPWGRKLYVQQKLLCELPKNLHQVEYVREKLQCYKHRKFMFSKIQSFLFLSFFPTDLECQEKCHAYDMPCCVHFTGYSQQLNFHMHYSFPEYFFVVIARTTPKGRRETQEVEGKMKNNSMYETRSDICNIFIFTCDEDGNHFTLYIKFMLHSEIFYNRLFLISKYLHSQNNGLQ